MKFLVALILALAPIPGRSEIDAWISEQSHDKISIHQATKFRTVAFKYSFRYDVDPFLVLAIMRVESGFRPNVVSSHGAIGVMQVIPRWHPEKVKSRSLKNIEVGTEVGVRVIAEYMKKHKTVKKALWAYSGGSYEYANRVISVKTSLQNRIGS